jgi:hypothetical protein
MLALATAEIYDDEYGGGKSKSLQDRKGEQQVIRVAIIERQRDTRRADVILELLADSVQAHDPMRLQALRLFRESRWTHAELVTSSGVTYAVVHQYAVPGGDAGSRASEWPERRCDGAS